MVLIPIVTIVTVDTKVKATDDSNSNSNDIVIVNEGGQELVFNISGPISDHHLRVIDLISIIMKSANDTNIITNDTNSIIDTNAAIDAKRDIDLIFNTTSSSSNNNSISISSDTNTEKTTATDNGTTTKGKNKLAHNIQAFLAKQQNK